MTLFFVGSTIIGGTTTRAQQKFDRRTITDSRTGWNEAAVQGFDMKLWINNHLTIGRQASPGQTIGCEYPSGSGIEHIFGAGPWIGGKVDGIRLVSEGYNGDNGRSYFSPNPAHVNLSRIWRTSVADSLTEPNRRGCDDDGDGLIDEDDLDGIDNDGDWNPASDDVGEDGIRDIDEVGCRGGYDAVNNPDPSSDNYEPGTLDYCRFYLTGDSVFKWDRGVYTEKNGIPDHGEPNVDEDYGALSDNDLYSTAWDDKDTVPGHRPMGIQVVQKSYAWKAPGYGAIIPLDHYFINTGSHTIRDVYVGYFMDADVGPVNSGSYWTRNYACYFDTLRTGYIHNPIDRGSTPIGLTVLGTPKPLEELHYIYRWFNFTTNPGPGTWDSLQYIWMTGEPFPDRPVDICGSPTNPSDTRFLFSFGPFDTFAPGETLKISIGVISGEGVDAGPRNLKENVERAQILYQRMQLPGSIPVRTSPPSPPLRFRMGERRVTLEWGSSGEGLSGTDPQTYWDIASLFAESFPAEHWRRTDPPCSPGGDLSGCTAPPCDSSGSMPGGRIFEGYRVYRSEDQGTVPDPATFTMIRDFDIASDGIGNDFGFDSTFVDSSLTVGRRYWYAVTSYGIPEMTVRAWPEATGGVRYDTIFAPGYESDLRENMLHVDITFRASSRFGEVRVVPNPYRVDRDYTTTEGGYEGNAYDWTDYKRKIRFIHLPRKCTIRIFTVAGDVITTLHYESPESDPDEGYLDWRLVSESKRPIASGMYVYTVESEFGTQYGKFVVIR